MFSNANKTAQPRSSAITTVRKGGKYTSGLRYWNVPVLVNTGTFLVYQYCMKMWYLRSQERAGVIQKLTILERKNGPVLSNTRVPVSGTWSILFPGKFSVNLGKDWIRRRPSRQLPPCPLRVWLICLGRKFQSILWNTGLNALVNWSTNGRPENVLLQAPKGYAILTFFKSCTVYPQNYLTKDLLLWWSYFKY